MTPPPTSIDGTDITGATIDGQEVQEITIDGQTVFSAGPDPVIQYLATTYTQGDATWADDATADGAQDMSITGDPQDGTLSDGSESLVWDGSNDFGRTTLPTSLEASGLREFSVEFAFEYSDSAFNALCGLVNDDSNQRLVVLLGIDSNLNSSPGNILMQLFDDNRSKFEFGPSSNPNLDDGNRHDVSIVIEDSTTNSASIFIDGSEVSISTNNTGSPSNFVAWDDGMVHAAREQSSIIQNLNGEIGAVRWYDSAIASQTINDYP
jgi:hypothetical protein